MPDITQADRLRNEPVKVTLNNGETYELSFGFDGLRKIEAKFDSVQVLMDHLAEPLGKGFHSAIVDGLVLALWKQRMTEDKLIGLLDSADSLDYSTSLMESLGQNFPHQIRKEFLDGLAEAKAEMAKAESDGSPTSSGTSTTTSPPPLSAVQTSSSGT